MLQDIKYALLDFVEDTRGKLVIGLLVASVIMLVVWGIGGDDDDIMTQVDEREETVEENKEGTTGEEVEEDWGRVDSLKEKVVLDKGYYIAGGFDEKYVDLNEFTAFYETAQDREEETGLKGNNKVIYVDSVGKEHNLSGSSARELEEEKNGIEY